jgi:hypothetical protein
MKYLIGLLFIASAGSIIAGFLLKPEPVSEKLIGYGVVGLFLFVIPLFTYHRWKGRKVKDYMLSKENIKKMQDYQDEKKI